MVKNIENIKLRKTVKIRLKTSLVQLNIDIKLIFGIHGFLEDVHGSWPETWRKGESLTSYIMLLDDQEDIL